MRSLRVVNRAAEVRCGPLCVALCVVPLRPARVRVRAVQRHVARSNHFSLLIARFLVPSWARDFYLFICFFFSGSFSLFYFFFFFH
jgi:hypothetical protein